MNSTVTVLIAVVLAVLIVVSVYGVANVGVEQSGDFLMEDLLDRTETDDDTDMPSFDGSTEDTSNQNPVPEAERFKI